MRIGIVVDGVSEYASLAPVLSKVADRTGHVYLRVVKADIQPTAPFPVIARACRPSISQLAARGAELVLVVLDREDRPECPTEIANGVRHALEPEVDCRISIIVKDRQYENWLVADLHALRSHPARFHVTNAHRRAVEPNRADAADAAALLRAIVQRGSYEKVDDSRAIMATAEPERIAQHSRSFRKFLREAGHPRYQTQSKVPT
jgi:hypothetical protein